MIRLDLSGSTCASFTAGGDTHEVDVARGWYRTRPKMKSLSLGLPSGRVSDG